MAAFWAGLVLAILPQEAAVCRESVDLAEVNHYYDEQGRLVFDQVIFWDWDHDCCRHQVVAWRLVKHPSLMPYRDWRGGWSVTFVDGETLRDVSAPAFRETWTQHDPELEERQTLPKEKRRELRHTFKP